MRLSRVVTTIALTLVVPALAAAQETGPRRGSWAAEATATGEASLLRFRSNTFAWLIGFSGFYINRDEEDPSVPGDEATLLTARLGIRNYRATESRVRPFTTFAALAGYNDNVFLPRWEFGGQFEYGAAYFFNRNASLGASFALRALYGRASREAPFGEEFDVRQITVTTGLRFLGAVYF